MLFTPHGKHLVAGNWIAGDTTFRSEPADGPAHDFSVGTPALVDRAACSLSIDRIVAITTCAPGA